MGTATIQARFGEIAYPVGRFIYITLGHWGWPGAMLLDDSANRDHDEGRARIVVHEQSYVAG
jgi:hypothetical protein